MKTILFFILFSIPLLGAPTYGLVKEYNSVSKEITIITPTSGIFKPGKEIYTFTSDRESGKVKISRLFHSKVVGKVISGNPLRNDYALANRNDIKLLVKERGNVVSFKDVGSEGRSWISKFNCAGLPASAEQTRKIDFPIQLTYKEKGKDFYSAVDMTQIKSMSFKWNGESLNSKAITLKTGKSIMTDEIISNSIYKKLKPDSENISKVKECSVTPVEPKDTLLSNPDGLKLTLSLEKAYKEMGEDKDYILKVYSNSIFVQEYLLTKEQIKQSSFSKDYSFHGYELSPGTNSIEFFLVQVEEQSGEYFEIGTPIVIGSREIEYGEKNSLYEFLLEGKSKYPGLK